MLRIAYSHLVEDSSRPLFSALAAMVYARVHVLSPYRPRIYEPARLRPADLRAQKGKTPDFGVFSVKSIVFCYILLIQTGLTEIYERRDL